MAFPEQHLSQIHSSYQGKRVVGPESSRKNYHSLPELFLGIDQMMLSLENSPKINQGRHRGAMLASKHMLAGG